MRIRKSRCVELNWTRCCTEKFNMALSLCGVLRVALYFSEGFSEAAAGVSVVAEALQTLGETMVCFLGQESSLWLSRLLTVDFILFSLFTLFYFSFSFSFYFSIFRTNSD